MKQQEMTLKISRTKIAALGASALLIIGGASVAMAQNPQAQSSQAAPEPAVEEPAGPDTDNIQEGDQNGAEEADDANESGVEEADDANESGVEEADDANESDGPGGHEDADDGNADHQFEGEE